MIVLNKHHLTTILFCIFTLIGFSITAIVMNMNEFGSFDKVIISFIQGLETPTLTAIMKFFTHLGSFKWIQLQALIFCIFTFVVFRHRSEIVLLFILAYGERYLNRVIKGFFKRERPEFNRSIEIGGYSFPSGHAMNAMAFYGIIVFLLWPHIPSRWGRMLLLLISSSIILVIGISRVYLGVHYPSDIIAGYFASGFLIAISILIYCKFKEWRDTKALIKK
ncbi:phosphatase PAP2 family protein [Ureibacillus acetophenoni]